MHRLSNLLNLFVTEIYVHSIDSSTETCSIEESTSDKDNYPFVKGPYLNYLQFDVLYGLLKLIWLTVPLSINMSQQIYENVKDNC